MLPLMNVSASKNARLEIHLSDSTPKLRANVTQMRQVLLNLVTNAAEALAGKEGVISIRLTEASPAATGSRTSTGGQWLRLEVSDTGCGMTDQVRAGMFDPFFTTKGAGRGLGLAAVQGIVRSHGGKISVVSAPGRGSRFDILLPCGEMEELPGAGPDLSFPNRAGEFHGTVLIVEDEEMLRRAIVRLLVANGVRVLETADGTAAVELFRTHASEIDVVLLDVTLPGCSGREVLQSLRQIQPSAKVIITSAYGRERALAHMNAEPGQAYIRKPYRVKELLELIQKTCRNDGAPASNDARQSIADMKVG
jgi:CheY-like chemotaxis protein